VPPRVWGQVAQRWAAHSPGAAQLQVHCQGERTASGPAHQRLRVGRVHAGLGHEAVAPGRVGPHPRQRKLHVREF